MTFDQVGGLEQYIKALKEMVFLPLVYPELFERFHIAPPRGVLFYGPPGGRLSLALCETMTLSGGLHLTAAVVTCCAPGRYTTRGTRLSR